MKQTTLEKHHRISLMKIAELSILLYSNKCDADEEKLLTELFIEFASLEISLGCGAISDYM